MRGRGLGRRHRGRTQHYRGERTQRTLIPVPISQIGKLRPSEVKQLTRLPWGGLGIRQPIKTGAGLKLRLSFVGLGGDLNFLYFSK